MRNRKSIQEEDDLSKNVLARYELHEAIQIVRDRHSRDPIIIRVRLTVRVRVRRMIMRQAVKSDFMVLIGLTLGSVYLWFHVNVPHNRSLHTGHYHPCRSAIVMSKPNNLHTHLHQMNSFAHLRIDQGAPKPSSFWKTAQ
jgi:hypothetical protein